MYRLVMNDNLTPCMRALFLILALLAFSPSFATVTIKGKILNYDGRSLVLYQPTVQGIFAPYVKEVKPDAAGEFVISFENPGLGTTVVAYKALVYRFLHDSDSKIYVEFDQSKLASYNPFNGPRLSDVAFFFDSLKQVATTKISGSHEAVNRYYNQNLRTSMQSAAVSIEGNFYAKMIHRSATPARAKEMLDSLIQREASQIEKLPHPVSENPAAHKQYAEIKKFLTDEMQNAYAVVFLNGMWLKRKEQIEKLAADPQAERRTYNKQWEEMIIELCRNKKPQDNPMVNSKDYYDWLGMYSNALETYNLYAYPKASDVSRDQNIPKALFKMDSIYKLDKKYHLAVTLPTLQNFLYKETDYSITLLNNVYLLQSMYPESEHIQFYNSQVKKIETYLKTAPYEKAIILEDSVQTFSSLLERFKGKPLLLDVWATWCSPCVYEFKFKDSVDAYRDQGQFEVLYISVDRPADKDRWRRSINFNKLSGYHVLADSTFQQELWKALGEKKGAIPRYVLFNAKGKIVKAYMARPSQEVLFRKHLEAVLKD